jgi:signal transduction histidine kinase
MKSVYMKVIVYSAVLLIFSLAAVLVISRYIRYLGYEGAGPIAENIRTQFEAARTAYETGGQPAIAAYVRSQETQYPGVHFYLTLNGRDVATGTDVSQLTWLAATRWRYLLVSSQVAVSRTAADTSLVFIVAFPAFGQPQVYVLFFALVAFVVVGMCWILASQFAEPLNQLAQVVEHFGDGDLSARIHSKRKDEIGNLAMVFNRMADQIQTLLRSQHQLLQDISHELRSPLTRLGVAVELTRSDSERENAIAQVHKEVDRLTTLLEGLIQMTRVEGDPQARQLQKVTVDDLLRQLVEDCNIEASAHHCRVVMQCEPGLTMKADTELLRRAIENVLRNAIRYAPPNSDIEVTLQRKESNASIAVRDYGPGVPQDALDHIFDAFYRVDSSRDMSTGGIGLGLSIAQRAVRFHQGQVRAENANPGLRVSFELPLQAQSL